MQIILESALLSLAPALYQDFLELTISRLFVARKSLRALFFYFLKDIIFAYTASSPHGSWQDIKRWKQIEGFGSYPFWHRFWFAWVHIAMTYVTLEFTNSLVGVMSVATGLANPTDCPSAFGNFKGLISVRNAWS